nr:FMRFamide receptor-like [Biomphalaria glabrata]
MSMTSEILLLINVTNFLNINADNTLYVYSGGGNLTSDDSTFAPNFTSHCDRSINGLENLHFYFNGVTMAVWGDLRSRWQHTGHHCPDATDDAHVH